MIKPSWSKRNITIGIALFTVALAAPLSVGSSIVSAEDTVDTSESTSTDDAETTTGSSEYQKRIAERAAEIQKQAAERADEIRKQAAERAGELEAQAAERAKKLEDNDSENGEVVRTRLTEAKLKACQNREKNIKNIAARVDDRGTKQLDVFSKIAERTKAFYEEKGNVLGSYDDLVLEVDAKEAAARAAVVEVKAAGSTFACDSTDPKGTIDTFKLSLSARDDALKAYKTAVKNLIVGVKSVQPETVTAEENE